MPDGEEYAGLVAVKRLSAVEVDPRSSHQHEFHADRLRRELGFSEDGGTGPLTAIAYGTAHAIAEERATYTLYQARTPPRNEFRLYPTTSFFQEHARAGDLLLVYREPGSDALAAVVAQAGSRAEHELLDALFAGDVPTLRQFRIVRPREAGETIAAVAAALAAPAAVPLAPPAGVMDYPLFATAVETHTYPTTAEMAQAAVQIVTAGGAPADPDGLLYALLENETMLFYAIEKELASEDLRVLLETSPDLTSVLDFARGRFQSRFSRRGTSLQNHLGYVLAREEIPHTPQCTPESPPPADFMIPSCDSYHDPSYPAEGLRMVSCKSTTRERWYETIPESAKIRTKYLLTLDEKLSDNKVNAMWNADVVPFLPQQIIEDAYAGRAISSRLLNVGRLIAELRAALE